MGWLKKSRKKRNRTDPEPQQTYAPALEEERENCEPEPSAIPPASSPDPGTSYRPGPCSRLCRVRVYIIQVSLEGKFHTISRVRVAKHT